MTRPSHKLLLSSLILGSIGATLPRVHARCPRPFGQSAGRIGSTWMPKKKRNRKGRDPQGRSGYLS